MTTAIHPPSAAIPGQTCARCRGSVYLTQGADGLVHKCLSCGHEQPRAPATAAATATPAAADWQRLVRGQISRLCQEIADVTEKQRECERLVAALRAYGSPSLPELPWATSALRPKRAEGGARRSPALRRGTCVRCGYEAGLTAFLRDEGGGYHCRSAAGCAVRARERQTAAPTTTTTTETGREPG